MEIFQTSEQLKRWRRGREQVAFVPTMGYLHAGHESLLAEGRRRGKSLVLSIFVNPAQFGPREDLSRYPRNLEADLEAARRHGVDAVFVPEAAAIYPSGFQTYVEVRELSRPLCGASRPGHFVGVATVVFKLFHLVAPDLALFGQKDFQQLQIIRRMVRDLDLDVEIVGMPIVREPDGLALSSRNSYLSEAARTRSLCLSRGLVAAERAFSVGERNASALMQTAMAEIVDVKLDYLELRDAESLALTEGSLLRPTVLAVAAFVDTTRLIDNVVLCP